MLKRIREKIAELQNTLAALSLAYRRMDVSLLAKIVIAAAVAYALSPVDLIPDFIPVVGYLDDLLIVPLLVILAVKLIGKPVMDECRAEAKNLWRDGKPKKWRYAIPIVLTWVLLAVIVVKMFLGAGK